MSSSRVVGTTDATLAVLSAGSGPADGSAPNGAADFLAAILQALTPEGATDGSGAGVPAAPDVPGTDATAPDATGAAAALDAAALGLVAPLVPPVVAVVAVPGAGVPGEASADQVGVAGVGAAPEMPGDPGISAGTASPALSAGALAAPQASGGRGARGHANVATGTDAAPTGTTGDIRMSGDANTPPTTTGAPVEATSTGTPTDTGAGQGGQPGFAVPVTAAGPTASGPAQAAPAAPVTGQVFPYVTSLFSRGDGTHRITLTLKPEALGEVRVVMTVRDGAVHVRLAGGHEAHQALLEGSPELSRLLEQAGATETRIVVRDLSGAVAPTTGGGSTDQGFDLGQGLGAGSNRSQDEHAGTRAEQQATEGSHHTTTPGAASSRTVEPATRTRTSGVDVTM